MVRNIVIGLLVLAAIGGALFLWRSADLRADSRLREALISEQPESPELFDPAIVAGLPEPARRYFGFAILPGTPLRTVASIIMEGELGLGTQEEPRYMKMYATQTLGGLDGFLWQVVTRQDEMWISGSDAAFDSVSWSRFWLIGLIPVRRAGGTEDHYRSSVGRYVAEAVFWTPAALLPRDGVVWTEIGADQARVTVTKGGMIQVVDIEVDIAGMPVVVSFQRWTDANPDKVFRLQKFGGYLSEFKTFNGFQLPTQVEAGNNFGGDAYFPFYKAKVTSITFPD